MLITSEFNIVLDHLHQQIIYEAVCYSSETFFLQQFNQLVKSLCYYGASVSKSLIVDNLVFGEEDSSRKRLLYRFYAYYLATVLRTSEFFTFFK